MSATAPPPAHDRPAAPVTPSGAVARWPPLTTALDDRTNPIRVEVDQLLTAAGVREVQREYRAVLGPFQVASFGSNAGTIGTAFDLALRFLITPQPNMRLAAHGAAKLGQAPFAALHELVGELGAVLALDTGPAASPITAPLRTLRRETEKLSRACWALALFVEVFRVGRPFPDSPLIGYLAATSHPAADGLLALATPAAVDELVALLDLARTQLLVPLAEETPPWYLGPTFTASQWMNADADLVAGRALVEVKTNLGDKKPDGSRVASLTRETLRQLLGYVLHDVDDTYRLERAAVYDARYGTLSVWLLSELLDRLAGRQVDLSAAREAHRRLLQERHVSVPSQ
jgi:hypothetical protein